MKKPDSFELFKQLINHASVALAAISVDDGTWLAVNDAYCTMLGYTEDELRALSEKEITLPEDQEVCDPNSIQKQLHASSQGTCTIEKRYIHKLGCEISVYLTISLISDPNTNTPSYLLQEASVIPKSSASADQEWIRNGDLRTLFSVNAQDLFSSSTPDGIIVDVSPSIKNILGYEHLR